MRTLLHMPLDPHSRKVRLILAEKGLATRLVETPPWTEHPDLMAHNPAGTIPVLIDDAPTGSEIAVSPAGAISEYLDEAYREPLLMPATSAGRAEVRRLCAWFDEKFEKEVNAALLRRRIDDNQQGRRAEDDDHRRVALEALSWHLDYISYLLEQRAWLAGEKLSIADLTAAAHFSANDYIGVMPWRDFPHLREWYRRMKSRPSMRPLLADRLDGTPPPPHYANPDF